MAKDIYGRPDSHMLFGKQANPYQMEEDTSTGITYIRYFNDTVSRIWRVTTATDGTVTTTTFEYADGAWADRATLTYAPINDWN
jgi:hypothetical protein